ncbi:capsid maturation protease [Psittacid alphaherpesvirus 5]|uniref:Capsid scaffolding protein n=1 Tax=Psittacid alphaherpesvirus 5 TaxID=2972693 RepID=A0A5P9JQ73_9ALPH|nr:capsid maturation protease [Psittacid alphaherpesvirus 5]QFU14563.1 capsid maturation protease [Psittacid alphaherpesvirus 5]
MDVVVKETEKLQSIERDRIYVAGFLVVYSNQASDRYWLGRDTVREALPAKNIVPININHEINCIVGNVIFLTDDDKGLFCVGLISPDVERVLMKYVPSELFPSELLDDRNETVRFLYILSNILPALSLSSRLIGDEGLPDNTVFFEHVALCELGKRDGTIAIYGTAIEEVLDAFGTISSKTKDLVIDACKTSANTFTSINESTILEALMRKFVGSAFLMNRGRLLRAHRETADIHSPKYLQASAVTSLNKERSAVTPISEKEKTHPPSQVQKSTSGNAREKYSETSVTHASHARELSEIMSNGEAIRSCGIDEFVYVPYTKYAKLLDAASGDTPPECKKAQSIHSSAEGTCTIQQHSCSNQRCNSNQYLTEGRPGRFLTDGHPNLGIHYGYSQIPPVTGSTWPVPTPPIYIMNPPQNLCGSRYPPEQQDRSSFALEEKLDRLLDALKNSRDPKGSGAPKRKSARETFGDDVGTNDSDRITADMTDNQRPYFPGEERAPLRKHARNSDEISDVNRQGISELLTHLMHMQRDIADMKRVAVKGNGEAPSERDSNKEIACCESTHSNVQQVQTVDASNIVSLNEVQKTLGRKKETATFIQMMAD